MIFFKERVYYADEGINLYSSRFLAVLFKDIAPFVNFKFFR